MKKEFNRRYEDLFKFVPIGFFTFDQGGQILAANPTGAKLLGTRRSDLLKQNFTNYIVDDFQDGFQQHCKKVFESGNRETYDLQIFKKDRASFWAQLESIAIETPNKGANGCHVNTAITDITDRKQAEDELCSALEKSNQQAKEVAALLESSRAVLQYREFKDSAESLFNSCKNLIGASAGYVALLAKDGTENELLHPDSGGLACTVDPALLMPIRGLREKACRTCKTVFDNRFSHSEWVKFLPSEHVTLDNVLFAPLVIDNKAVGLLGLVNKPGGFTEQDARIASGFSEFASVALFNSRTLESLAHSEERFRSVVETAIDAIITVDSRGTIIFWNPHAERMFGYSANEIVGKPVAVIMPERFRQSHQRSLNKAASGKKSKIAGNILELIGLRKDGHEFPLELSLANWETKEGVFFTAIIRDISERKQAESALQKTRNELERRVNERTCELGNTNSKLRKQILECEQAKRALRESELKYATLVEDALIGVYIILDGKIDFANDKFADIYGYSKEELIGMDSLDLVHPDDRPLAKKLREKRLGGEKVPAEYESRGLKKNGDIIWVMRSFSQITYKGRPAISGIVANISKRRRAEEALQKSDKELRVLSNQLLSAEEKERKRIARELHDSIGQALSAIKFSVENALLELRTAANPIDLGSLEAVIPLTQKTIEEVRRIVKDLRPSILDDLGILATIGWFCREFQSVYAGIRIETTIDIEENEVPLYLKTTIYRIMQEALNNVAKHSNANFVQMQLLKTKTGMHLNIHDNGRGFNLDQAMALQTSRRGFGLASMRERAELSGAAFEIDSAKGQGTAIHIAWPAASELL
ncbi:MAG: PAS domain S-box protein [Desulfobacterales bacterium]|jgi:PAS domain S-box-containing protein